MTDLLCPACHRPKPSAKPLCRACLYQIHWTIRAALWAAYFNLKRHPDEPGARARYASAKAAAIRSITERTPEPAA